MANFTPQEIEEMLREFFNVVGKRQYTGARYVPIFGRKNEESIVWDNSAPYEPLTIVLYQGNSYTSRQYVPQGVDITDTAFWANTGNYNAQVEQYRQDVANLSTTVEGQITAINGEITTIEEDIETIDTSIDAITEHLINLDNGIQAYSITDAVTGTGNVSSMQCVITPDCVVWVDCGSTISTASRISAIAREILGARKIDVLIVTHFHADHIGQPNALAEFASDDMQIFIQMEPSATHAEYAAYTSGKAALQSAFPNTALVVPTDKSIISHNKTDLYFFNTDTAYDSVYLSGDGENANLIASLNNYSLQCRVSYERNSVLITGDIEYLGQKLNANSVIQSDVMFIPHHGVNAYGHPDFWCNCNPKALIDTRQNLPLNTGVNSPFYAQYRYWSRYAYSKQIPMITLESGYKFACSINYGTPTPIYNCINYFIHTVNQASLLSIFGISSISDTPTTTITSAGPTKMLELIGTAIRNNSSNNISCGLKPSVQFQGRTLTSIVSIYEYLGYYFGQNYSNNYEMELTNIGGGYAFIGSKSYYLSNLKQGGLMFATAITEQTPDPITEKTFITNLIYPCNYPHGPSNSALNLYDLGSATELPSSITLPEQVIYAAKNGNSTIVAYVLENNNINHTFARRIVMQRNYGNSNTATASDVRFGGEAIISPTVSYKATIDASRVLKAYNTDGSQIYIIGYGLM